MFRCSTVIQGEESSQVTSLIWSVPMFPHSSRVNRGAGGSGSRQLSLQRLRVRSITLATQIWHVLPGVVFGLCRWGKAGAPSPESINRVVFKPLTNSRIQQLVTGKLNHVVWMYVHRPPI